MFNHLTAAAFLAAACPADVCTDSLILLAQLMYVKLSVRVPTSCCQRHIIDVYNDTIDFMARATYFRVLWYY